MLYISQRYILRVYNCASSYPFSIWTLTRSSATIMISISLTTFSVKNKCLLVISFPYHYQLFIFFLWIFYTSFYYFLYSAIYLCMYLLCYLWKVFYLGYFHEMHKTMISFLWFPAHKLSQSNICFDTDLVIMLNNTNTDVCITKMNNNIENLKITDSAF